MTMVAACAVARQKLPASSNGVGSRVSSDRRRSTQLAGLLGVPASGRLDGSFAGRLGAPFSGDWGEGVLDETFNASSLLERHAAREKPVRSRRPGISTATGCR